MNKKLLFAAMSLAALTACNSDDFESKNVAQQETSPVVFEVLNNNDAFTRASMNGNKVAWSAKDGDLFTLYHGGVAGTIGTTYQNATFKAEAGEGEVATLTTPSMILPGGAVMVWPVDTTFRALGEKPSLVIPEVLPKDVENYIPYVSDEINIVARDGVKVFNSAGYNRVYPIYMRPMASQLNLKADYVGLETLEALYEGSKLLPDDGLGGIDPIKVTSVELVADEGNTPLTKEIALKLTNPDDLSGEIKASDDQWKSVAHNAWNYVTDFDKTAPVQTAKLTTKCVKDLDESKFLILPLKANLGGAEKAGIIVNTSYGKVIVSDKTVGKGIAGAQYEAEEIADAWYRFISADTKALGAGVGFDANEHPADAAGSDGKFKTTANIAVGLKQTLNGFSSYTATSGIVKHEPIGASATRYVKVLLKYLQIDGTHVKTNKQLRDIALIWKYLGIGAGGVTTVYLDGDANNEFEITQKTINFINDLNLNTDGRSFAVAPCNVGDEECHKIVVTGGGDIQNLIFIKKDAATADVVFKAGETWKWNGTVTLATAAETGVKSFINEGTMENAATATLAILDNTTPNPDPVAIPLVNKGTWNIKAGATINVKFEVWNTGTVNIEKGAQYREDGATNTFYNYAETLPQRFLAKGKKELIGVVINKGVFATVNNGTIINIGLIEHKDKDAKTYITYNQYGPGAGYAGVNYAAAFKFDVDNTLANMIGRINLPYENKDEDNISVSAALTSGFVSVTIDGEVTGTLSNNSFGSKVNYVIVKSGVSKIAKLDGASSKIKYFEVDMSDKSELEWSVTGGSTFDGLIVLSPVNITLGTTITVNKATYLGADMYVGGTFTPGAGGFVDASWDGYYGPTHTNYATKYITY